MYYAKKAQLLASIEQTTSDHVDKDLVRDFALTRFNMVECEMITPKGGPLASIAYDTKTAPVDLAERIAQSMYSLPWKEVYGLDVNAVLDLPFDRWWEMSDRLSDYVTKRGAPLDVRVRELLEIQNDKIDLLIDHIAILIKMQTAPKRKGKSKSNGHQKSGIG